MKRKVFIFLSLTIMNILRVCAMDPTKNVEAQQPSEWLSSGESICFDDDSDSDGEKEMPTLGDDSDGENEPEDSVSRRVRFGGGVSSAKNSHTLLGGLDLALPIRRGTDQRGIPHSGSKENWYGSELIGEDEPLLPLLPPESVPDKGEELRPGVVLPPPADITDLPLPAGRSGASIESEYSGQGLLEGAATRISRDVDASFPPESLIVPELPSEDGEASLDREVFAAAERSASASVSQSSTDKDTAPPCSDVCAPLMDPHEYNREFNAEVQKANERLNSCKGIVEVSGRTVVIGDLHGDLNTLTEIVKYISARFESGELQSAVFLGDIMDRGEHSAATLLELIEFFNVYDGKVHDGETRPRAAVYIIRGNHETSEMFLAGTGSGKVAREDPLFQFVDKCLLFKFFDNLPYAAIINGNTLAIHGGVPFKNNWETFRAGEKYSEWQVGFSVAGIREAMWSDYATEIDPNKSYIGISLARGAETPCFNEAAAKEFLEFMKCKYMIRGHQPSLGVFHRSPKGIVTTVFSAIENQGVEVACIALVEDKPSPMPYANIHMAP